MWNGRNAVYTWEIWLQFCTHKNYIHPMKNKCKPKKKFTENSSNIFITDEQPATTDNNTELDPIWRRILLFLEWFLKWKKRRKEICNPKREREVSVCVCVCAHRWKRHSNFVGLGGFTNNSNTKCTNDTHSPKNKIQEKTMKCNKNKWNVSFFFGRTRNAFSLISRKLLNKNEQMYSHRSDEHEKLLACCCIRRQPYLQLYRQPRVSYNNNEYISLP